jgi:light-regulated signal transduction histidine kinase (bacteriophytochrome)
MPARGRMLGVMTFVWAESNRRYSQADFELAEDLGRRAGMAVDNARLFDEVHQLNQSLEKRVAERTAALEDANRELESFSYSVSHDLRAPLRHVSGFVELLEKQAQGKLDERGEHYLSTIRDASSRAGQLVDDLLAFSRMGRSAMRSVRVEMNKLLDEVRSDLAPDLAGRTIDWQVSKLPSAQGDPALLRLVWINLLSNAIKFTAKRPSARIEISSAGQDDQTLYTVRDDGAGFDPAYMDKLFGVFQRLHSAEEFEGTGIGLATVRRIVARHGGKIWAESQPGRGAAFHFTLPKAQEGTP